MVDPAFGLNSFNTAKYYNESQTTANNIMFILEGRPGCYPSIPELGMNIRQLLYRPMDEINTDAIKVELARQCSYFLTNIRNGTFDVQKTVYQGNPLLVFVIPVTVEQVTQQLAIGVTTNTKGELMYSITYIEENDYIVIN